MKAAAKRVPEYFISHVRKVEAIGSDCVRIYCAIERDGKWEDQFTCIVPFNNAVANSQFVIRSATEIHNEAQLKITACH